MAKSRQDKTSEQSGTPAYVMVSILFALLIFASEGFKDSVAVGATPSDFRMSTLALIGLGLALCFFWRRLQESALRTATALFYTGGLWVYLLLVVLGPMMLQGDASKLIFISQFGYGAILLSCLLLLATFFYDTRLVPSLMLATIAGLTTSLGSVWGLIQFNQFGPQPHELIQSHSEASEEDEEISAAHYAGSTQESDHTSKKSGHAQGAESEHADAPDLQQVRAKLKAYKPAHEEGEGHESAPVKSPARSKAAANPAHASVHATAPKVSSRLAAHAAPDAAPAHAPAAAPAHASAHWEYTGSLGAEAWGDLDPSYKLCGIGKEQSPIDLPASWPLRQDLELQYRPSSFDAIDNGHTVQFNVEPGNYMTLNGKRYELKQIHFHTPSEHFVGGRSSILEAHFVHASATGELAVLGSLIQAGIVHREYQKLWEFMPFSRNEPVRPRGKTFDPRSLLPLNLGVYRYPGSLTTPPCSEKVTWNVLAETVQMSQEQINRLRAKYRNNARPIQPLNQRE